MNILIKSSVYNFFKLEWTFFDQKAGPFSESARKTFSFQDFQIYNGQQQRGMNPKGMGELLNDSTISRLQAVSLAINLVFRGAAWTTFGVV